MNDLFPHIKTAIDASRNLMPNTENDAAMKTVVEFLVDEVDRARKIEDGLIEVTMHLEHSAFDKLREILSSNSRPT